MVPAYDHRISPRTSKAESRPVNAFGSLPAQLAAELDELSYSLLFPTGTVLFSEGEPARGVFIVGTGRVKLSICAGDGKTLILRLAEPGDVVGLPGTLSGNPYEVTAAAIGPCRVAYVKRDSFLRFMHAHQEICLGVAEQLRKMYCSACHEIRRIGLSHSASEKLAELLVGWPVTNGDSPIRIPFPFSHEEVGQMIGSSRETVSRAFANFKRKRLAELHGATLHIRDRAALRAIAAGDASLAKSLAATPRPSPERAGAKLDGEDYFHPDGV